MADTPITPSAPAFAVRAAASLWPGLGLVAALAGTALLLRQLPGVSVFSPMILAVLLGIAFHNLVGTPAWARAGIVFSARRLLRLAIVLLGLQLTAQQVAEVGLSGVAVIAATLLATFVFTKALARLLGVERGLAELIAAGTSVCGASAVVAANSVTEAGEEDVAYAIACVTLFGSLAMFLYPLLPGLLGLGARDYGLWAGASIHEVAQAVAAAFQGGQQAGEFGTVAKLTRVMLLAPLVLALGLLALRRPRRTTGGAPRAKVPLPWFVLGFVLLVLLNSLVAVPPAIRGAGAEVTAVLLSMALAALGLATDLRKLRRKGLRPLALGAASWLFIAAFSLVLVKLVQ